MYLKNAVQHKIRAKLESVKTVYEIGLIEVLWLFSPAVLCSGYFPMQKVIDVDCQLLMVLRYKWGTEVLQNRCFEQYRPGPF